MTIIQLETFLKIIEAGSFSGAADLLSYAQSTVTTQIKQLETELGCHLFDRLGKTVAITPEGEKLSFYAEKILQLQRELLSEIPPLKEAHGTLKLGISESLCYGRLPQLLLEYKRLCPKVDIQLKFISQKTFPLMLKNGSLDIVYTLNPYIELPELRLLYKKKESLGFYTSPNHVLAKRRKIKEADLDQMPLLLTAHDCSFRAMLLDDLRRSNVTPRIILETSSKEILKQFSVNEFGIAFMPDMAVQKELDEKRLVKLDWSGADFPIFSQIFIHKDKHINKAIDAFIQMISNT